MKTVMRNLRRMATERQTDAELLEAFVRRRDEAAFEVLLRRHGPMVLGVCLRVLRNRHDAEDAFQATFLVLARKAASVKTPNLLGHWLYGVASRTALKARAMNAKRRANERRAAELTPGVSAGDEAQQELLCRLDEALNSLPEKYRVPVVLCELEGRSIKELARSLGIPLGTAAWRLDRGRKLLAGKMARYGLAVSAGALTPRWTSAGVHADLVKSTAGAALGAGAVSAHVLALTEGVVKAMLLNKLKVSGAVFLAVCVSAGVGLTYRGTAAEPRQSGDPAAARGVSDELEELRLEVAALRKGLEVTRERVKTLENEVQALKGAPRMPGMRGQMGGGGGGSFFGGGGQGPQVGGGQSNAPRGGGGGGPGLFGPGQTNSTRGNGPPGPGTPGQPGGGPSAGSGPTSPAEGGGSGGGGTGLFGPGSNQPLPQGGAVGAGGPPGNVAPPAGSGPNRYEHSQPAPQTGGLAAAEGALTRLRANPNDKEAFDALEKALRVLRRADRLKQTQEMERSRLGNAADLPPKK